MKGDQEQCLAAGMDGYLTKPIRPQELDELLDRIHASAYCNARRACSRGDVNFFRGRRKGNRRKPQIEAPRVSRYPWLL